VPRRFFVETLGCPKNAVDSEKVAASLVADGLVPAARAADADLVVLNTCAFVEAARQESVDVALDLAGARKPGARLVLTGCMAERYGAELAEALPEADAVVGFAGEGSLSEVVLRGRAPTGVRDLLELPRPAPRSPWAYLKVAEGCDRACAFCAIPSFRGRQRSRAPEAVLDEAKGLVAGGVREIVLVAQDLASYGRDSGEPGALVPLLRRLDALAADGLARLRLLYLYPSEVRPPLVDALLGLGATTAYFDLSLQHASGRLLRRMRRWGDGERFLSLIERVRAQRPDAAFRSSFIVGFPGETEDDHDALLHFLDAAQLDWAGFFPFSPEDGTAAAAYGDRVAEALVGERAAELGEVQDSVTRSRRDALVGSTVEVMVDGPADGGGAATRPPGGARPGWAAPDPGAPGRVVVGRTFREAPEIDGVVVVDCPSGSMPAPGTILSAEVTGAVGPDLEAVPRRFAP